MRAATAFEARHIKGDRGGANACYPCLAALFSINARACTCACCVRIPSKKTSKVTQLRVGSRSSPISEVYLQRNAAVLPHSQTLLRRRVCSLASKNGRHHMLQAWEPTIVHFPPALPPLVFASCVNDTLRAAPVPIPRLALCCKVALPLLPAGTTCQELMPQPSAVFELSTILVGGESRDVVVAHFPAWALFTVQGLMLWLDEGLMRWLIALECCVFRLVFERESRERIMLAHFLAWSSYIVVFFAICDGALLPAKARYKYYVDKGFVEGEDERLVEAWNLEWNQYCRLRQEQRHEVSVRRRQLLNRLRSRLRRRQAPRSLKEMRCRPCSELRANRWSMLVFLRRCKRRGIGGLFCGQARARPTSRAELSVDDEGNVQMRLCVLPQRSLLMRFQEF